MPSPAIIGASAVLCAVILHTRRVALNSHHASEDTRLRMELLTTWSIAIVPWFATFDAVVGTREAFHAPWLLVSLDWPVVLLVAEILCIQHQTLDFVSRRSMSSLQIESNAVSGLAFAIGGLLASNLGAGFAKAAAPMLSVVIFLCVAFVLPTPSLQPRSPTGATVHAAQRACLTYCIGFLLAAVITNVHGTWRRRLGFTPGTESAVRADGMAVAAASASAARAAVPLEPAGLLPTCMARDLGAACGAPPASGSPSPGVVCPPLSATACVFFATTTSKGAPLL